MKIIATVFLFAGMMAAEDPKTAKPETAKHLSVEDQRDMAEAVARYNAAQAALNRKAPAEVAELDASEKILTAKMNAARQKCGTDIVIDKDNHFNCKAK